jgi:hemolysin III
MAMSSIDLEPPRRQHSGGEILADTYVHGVGLGAGLVGSAILVWIAAMRSSPSLLVAVAVYVLGLLAMIAASAAYNVGYHTRFRAWFRRADHSAIFLMIAATYTPFVTVLQSGLRAVAMTAGIWVLSLLGVLLKLLTPVLFERMSVWLYLALGWAAVVIVVPISPILPGASLAALVAGGGFYTLGVLFHLRQSLPFHNAIWHGCVLVAALCHYLSILTGVVLVAA